VIVSIHQPSYLPWLGYFDRIAASDLHVVLDIVQFEKNSFINRNKIRTAEGWTWLTVPVETGGKFGDLAIERLHITDDPRWARKHRSAINQSYARALHFAQHAAFIDETYAMPWQRLVDLVERINGYLCDAFAIGTRIVKASSLGLTKSKSDLVLEICQKVGASTYLSGALGRDYLDRDAFERANIDVVFQDYRHPVYPQAHGGFEPAMAAIDLLFMCGPEAGKMLRTTRLAAPTVASS
jgi:hypothetical protein